MNGRFGLEAHDIFIQYDAAGAVVSETDNPSIESARRADTGLFVQGSVPLGASLSAAGGLRGDYVVNVNEGGYFGDRTVTNGAAAGFATLTAGPFANLTFTAQIARGFRDPTLSDRFYRGPTGRATSPATQTWSRKRACRSTWARGMSPASCAWASTSTTTASTISSSGTRPSRTTSTSAIAAVPGFAAWKWKRRPTSVVLRAGGGAEVARGLALDDDAALDDIPPDMASLVLRKSFGTTFSVFGRIALHADDSRPGPSEVAAPGHTNLDAGATWTIAGHLDLRGAATNLLKRYRDHASPDPRWVYAPGRTVSATLRVTF